MLLTGITEGMHVRLAGPEDHPLHGATGIADRVFTPAELWATHPLQVMDAPFAWLTGQVLVCLDERPRGGPRAMVWIPYVSVRPEDIEPA
jgi:hypothetical protein